MNLPNALTLLRILLVPVIVALVFFPQEAVRWAAFALFVVASASDYVDGYLARLMSSQTDLGRLLDPIADKILVAAVLLALAGTDDLKGWALVPAILILCREIVVTGLREFLAECRVPLPVSRLAKWKTALQLVAIAFIIIGPVATGLRAALIGDVLLWVAGGLTLVTGLDYLIVGFRHIGAAGGTPTEGGRAP